MFAVMDRVCETDVLVAVFSTKDLAKQWIRRHKKDPYSAANPTAGLRYESLDIEETELNPD